MLVGIDIVDVNRFDKHIENEKFLNKYFTEYECRYIFTRPNPIETLAGLYASKEAFLKALGVGIGGGINIKDIEINHEDSGRPYIKIIGEKAQKVFDNFNVKNIDLSISHTSTVSTAICILFD